ncbi:hypothetical protein GGI21_002463, partial [Coemansia aciculifera]
RLLWKHACRCHSTACSRHALLQSGPGALRRPYALQRRSGCRHIIHPRLHRSLHNHHEAGSRRAVQHVWHGHVPPPRVHQPNRASNAPTPLL